MVRHGLEHALSIIFMDEIDWMTMIKSGSGGDSKVQRTMLELLNQLDRQRRVHATKEDL